MKKLICLLLVLLYAGSLRAQQQHQETCGFDYILDRTNDDPDSKNNFDSLRFYIQKRIQENHDQGSASFVVQPNSYVIPVVFHLVGTNASVLTDAYVQAQLNLLNQGFANLLGSTYGVADDAQVEFCLAQTLPNGQPWSTIGTYNPILYYNTTPGITRCTTSVANTISMNHNMNATGANSQQALVNLAYAGFSSNNYFNIWVVDQISQVPTPYVNSVVGYAPFPLMGPAAYLDGVVMRLDGFGIGSSGIHYNQGRTLIHEAGHFLGLFHTFQFGCSEVLANTPCSTSGDECCDTPPAAVPNQTFCSTLSASPPNSCSETPNLPDMYENHMDYAYDVPGSCRNTFTDDQANRMHATIQVYRANLVSFSNLIATGLTSAGGCMAGAINPTFITNLTGGSVQLCTGQPIGFIAGAGATTYSWSFPGGSPSSVTGTNTPTGITYATPGTYNVTLNITDAFSNNFTSTIQIYVTGCTPYTGNKANWYFGYNCSVNFSTGIAVSQNPSSIHGLEASAAISDNTGNLLFYTDGRSVWNNTHAPMTNGNSTLNGSNNNGSFISSSQGVVIVPRPGATNRYYVYCQSDVDSPSNIHGISQYEVDMTPPGGTVMSTTPVYPAQNYATYESVTAIPHCNGTDYWLVVKPKNNTQPGLVNPGPLSTINNFFASYLVTNTGIANVPVLSNSAPFTPTTGYGGNIGISQMVISPDKKYLAFVDCGTGTGYIFYFDCGSGALNYLATLPGISGYGCAFSPNSKVLYVKAGLSVRQYDLANVSICSSNPPFQSFNFLPAGYSSLIGFYSSMQLGPDGRIYLARKGYTFSPQQFIGVINFPNVLNLTPTSNNCGYNFSGIPLLSPQNCMGDLPNDITGQLGPLPADFSFCAQNCGQVCFTNLGCGNTFAWNFGDGHSITGVNSPVPAGTNAGTTSGNFEYPCHTYAGPGTYVVTLSIDGGPAVTHTVNITVPAPPVITGPICPVTTGVPLSYFGPPGFNYSWTSNNSSPTTGNTQAYTTTWTTLPATLTLTITDPANGCSAATTVTVSTISPPTVTAVATPTAVCISSPTSTLFASGATSYIWYPGAISGNPITVSPLSTTIYTVTGSNSTGCSSTATVQVTYTTCTACSSCTPVGTSGTVGSATLASGVFCVNNNVTITGNVTVVNSELKMAPGITITIAPTGLLTLIGSHIYSCTDMWQGIVVQNGGRVTTLTSLIEDAVVAIDVTNNTQTTTVLNLRSTTFNKNRIGINIDNYTLGITSYPFSISTCIFTCRNIPFVPNSMVFPSTAAVGAAATNPGAPLSNPVINNTTYAQTGPGSTLKVPFAGAKSTAGIRLKNVGLTLNAGTTSPTYYELQIGSAGNTCIFDNQITCVDLINSNYTSVNNVYQNTITFGKGGTQGGIGINGVSDAVHNNRLRVQSVASSVGANRFVDCSRGIHTSNYFEHRVTFNDFRSTQVNTAPVSFLNQRGEYGVYMNTNRFRVCTVSDNSMYNLENGIILMANFGSYNVTGIPVTTGQYAGAVNFDRNTIRPHLPSYTVTTQFVANAIAAQNIIGSGLQFANSLTPIIQTANNNITSVYRGINYTNWRKQNIIINTNTITLVPDPFGFVSPTQFGINEDNCGAFTLSGNSIRSNTITGFGLVNPNVRGIVSNISNQTIVNCNTTNNITKGIEFRGNNASTSFSKNTMSNSVYGYLLSVSGVIGQQGSPTNPQDNVWSGTWPAGNFKTGTINSTSQTSKFYIRTTAISPYNPNGSTFTNVSPGITDYNVGGSFPSLLATSSNPLPLACLSFTASPNPNSPAALTVLLEQMAQNTIDYPQYPNESRVINRNQVFRMLKDQPSLINNSPVLQTFYSNSLNTNRQTFDELESKLLNDEMHSAIGLYSTINPGSPIEAKYKEFYRLAIKNADRSLSEADSTDIVRIANGCPFTDGVVVYQARALLNGLFNTYQLYEDNCNVRGFEGRLGLSLNDNTETGEADQAGFDAVLFPNPGASSFSIATFGFTEGLLELTVLDLNGKIIYKNNQEVSNALTNFDINADNGVYFVKLYNPVSKETLIKKLVIQK